MASQEIDWERLDKQKFFVVGIGLFSGVTTCLFPLTVIKTRQMASHDVSPGMSGALATARGVWAADGPRGFYRGFGTVVCGLVPGRVLYLTALEVTKSAVSRAGERLELSAAALAGAANFAGGAAASLVTQSVAVPVDVVSQRLMVAGMAGTAAGGSAAAAAASGSGAAAAAAAAAATAATQRSMSGAGASSSGRSSSTAAATSGARGAATAARPPPPSPANGLAMARLIIAQEGVLGLYRGFLPSVATFVPSSAMWWGAYGAWQKVIWAQLKTLDGGGAPQAQQQQQLQPGTGRVVAVQAASAVLAGMTASLATNPLDVIKTRLQIAPAVDVAAAGVAGAAGAAASPTWLGVARALLAEEGARGLLRGVAPRMATSAMWGTAMVSAYEFLKRTCALPEAPPPPPPGDEQ